MSRTSSGADAGEFPAGLERRRQRIEKYLNGQLDGLDQVPARLSRAIRYAVLGSGKRVRPLLVLLGCEAVGGKTRPALPAAAAFEYIHAFSLVHDDLPAMDDDDLRRGRPTLHRKFDEATAILAGDGLLTMAFEEMASLPAHGVSETRALAVIRLLAQATGAQGMVAGQQLDMEAEGKLRSVTEAQVEEIHRRKTGALITAAAEVGGFVGGGSATSVRTLRGIGEDLGLAFQIVDDLLDERSSQTRLGKSVRADRNRGKATYPAVVGVEESEKLVQKLVRRASRRIEGMGDQARGLAQLARFIADREA